MGGCPVSVLTVALAAAAGLRGAQELALSLPARGDRDTRVMFEEVWR